MGAAFALLVLILISVAVVVRTEAGRHWLIGQIEVLADPPKGRLHIGDLQTDLFSGATVTDITLFDDADAPIAHINRVEAHWRLGSLPHLLVIPSIHVVGAYILAADGPGGLNLVAVWDDGSPPSGERWSGLGLDVRVDELLVEGLSGRYTRGDRRFGLDGANLRTAVTIEGPAIHAQEIELDAGVTWPELGPLSLGGDLRWDPGTLWTDGLSVGLGPNRLALTGGLGRLDGDPTVGVALDGVHVQPESLVALTGTIPVRGVFDATGALNGPLLAPSATLAVTTPGGPVGVTATFDGRGARPTWSGSLQPHAVALDTFLPIPVVTVVDGTVTAQGGGVGWPDDLDGTAVFELTSPQVDTLRDLSARGSLALHGGVVTVSELDARGLGGLVQGAGEVRLLDEDGDLRVRSAELPLSALARFGVPDLRGRVRARGVGRFAWGDALGGGFDGTVSGSDLGWREVALDTVDGPAVARWSKLDGAHVEADLVATTLAAAPATVQRATVKGQGDLAPDGSLVASALVTGEGLSATGVTGERVVVDGRLSRDPKGVLDADARVETGRLAWEGWTSDHGGGRATLRGDAASLVLDLYEGQRSMLGFDGEADLRARSLRARRVVVAPTEALAWRSDGLQTVRLVEGGVEDLRLRLVSGPAWVEATGHGRKKDLLDLRFEAHEVRVGWLAELLPSRFAGYGGVVSARASMEGHAKKPKMYLEGEARQLSIPGFVEGLDAGLSGSDEECALHLEGHAATAGQTLATFVADAPFSLAIDAPGFKHEGSVDFRVTVPPVDAAQVQAVLPKVKLPSFRASAEVRLAGPVLSPDLTVVASGEMPVGTREQWVTVDLDAHTREGVLDLDGAVRERMERRVLVSGNVELALADAWRWVIAADPDRPADVDPWQWVGPLAVNLVPQRLGLQALSQFVDGVPASLRGEVSGGVHIGGTLRKPLVQGALFLSDARLGDLPLTPAVFSVLPAEAGFDVDGILGFDTDGAQNTGNEGLIHVSGFAPFSPGPEGVMAELARPGLNLTVKADAVPLRALAAAVPGMQADGGRLSASGTVTGSILDPNPDVGFALKGGEFTLDQTGVRYSQVGFSGGLTHDEAHIEDLHIQTTRVNGAGQGNIKGSLSVTRPGSVRELELRRNGEVETVSAVLEHPLMEGDLKFKHAILLSLPDKQLQIDGGLRIHERGRKLRAAGRIDVVDAKLVVPERFFTGGTDLALDPDVRVVRPGQQAKVEEVAATPLIGPGLSFPDWFEAEVNVHLNERAWLDATVPLEQMLGKLASSFSSIQARSVQLDGEMTVTVDRGVLSVEGEVRPERGTTSLLGRSFDIDANATNTISFTGRDYLDPVLNLQARYHPPAGEYGDILAKITGTPSAIEVQLEPESSDLAREDVLPVLLTGRPLNDLDATEQANIGSTLISAFGGLLKSANTGTNALDVFEFDSTGNLRLGRRIGDKVFLIATFNLVEPDPTKENVAEATVEWQLGRKWRLDLTTGTSGISSASLDRRWRF